MGTMSGANFAALVHILGFLTGAALYAMLMGLVLRGRPIRTAGSWSASFPDRLPIATAILGLMWNVAGLAAYGVRDLGVGQPHPFLMAVAFSALGFLPAVVVHSVLISSGQQLRGRGAPILVAVSYGVASVAATLQFWGVREASVPSSLAMQVLTISYGALTVPLLVMTRKWAGWPRRWWIIALSIFAVLAIRFSQHDQGQESWLTELVGHHASLPLAFAILYQDYRFALADIFLKRALALFMLVGVAAGLFVTIAEPLIASSTLDGDPVVAGTLLVLWVGTALLYPVMSRASSWFVDRIVLRRADYAGLQQQMASIAAEEESDERLLDRACALLQPALSARTMSWVVDPAGDSEEKFAGSTATIPVPTSEPPRYVIVVGPLAGGRRLLSDDEQILLNVANIIGRRIDALRIMRERMIQSAREQEMGKLATEAELRALRAQINPHFLFNALNTITWLVQASPERAGKTLMKLTALLRGVLKSGTAMVTLKEELALISAYLDIERERFEERLTVRIDVPDHLLETSIPSLILQPLVENAIKHGIARARQGGEVALVARSVGSDLNADGARIEITVSNTGSAASEIEIAQGRRRGVGLKNVEERLRGIYGEDALLQLTSHPASGTEVKVSLPISYHRSESEPGAAGRRA